MNANALASRIDSKNSRHTEYTRAQLCRMFPDESSAKKWLEAVRWPNRRSCGHCSSERTISAKDSKPMPYWCSSCRSYFSVKTGSPMEGSNLSLRTWVIAIHLMTTSLSGVTSMKLHRDLGITQKTAWYLVHRIRTAWNLDRESMAN